MSPNELSSDIDWNRIKHLLKLGIFAALMVFAADMILGWGTYYYDAESLPPMFARFLLVSDGRIIASALLGLVGIPLECLCWFAVYRLIKPYSEKDAHAYRAGIIGCLAFGGCGVHVPCCIAAYLLKRFYENDSATVVTEVGGFLIWFLLPATIIFLVFFICRYKWFHKIIRKIRKKRKKRPRIFSFLFKSLYGIIN